MIKLNNLLNKIQLSKFTVLFYFFHVNIGSIPTVGMFCHGASLGRRPSIKALPVSLQQSRTEVPLLFAWGPCPCVPYPVCWGAYLPVPR